MQKTSFGTYHIDTSYALIFTFETTFLNLFQSPPHVGHACMHSGTEHAQIGNSETCNSMCWRETVHFTLFFLSFFS